MDKQENQKKRISSIDLFRVYAIIAVILIHTNPFEYAFRDFASGNSGSLFTGFLYLAISNLTTLAVPFFFVVAGYFLHQKLSSDTHPERAFLHYFRRLVLIEILWVLFYHLVPSPRYVSFIADNGYLAFIMDELRYDAERPIVMLMSGNINHLWFLPALAISAAFVAVSSRKNMGHVVLPLSVFLYSIHLLRGSYAQTQLGTLVDGWFVDYKVLLEGAPVDNYLSAILFVNTGWCLASKKIAFPSRRALMLILAGITISVLETIYLNMRNGIPTYVPGNLIGTVPVVTGIAMVAFSMPEMGSNGLMSKFGRLTLGIYAVHYILVMYLRPLNESISHPYVDVIYPAVVYLASLVLVALFSKNRWLRYMVT